MEQYDDSLHICPHCGYDENTPPETPVQLMPGVVLGQRYIIGKVIGYGGFGITYIAYDTRLQIKVAVKEYLPGEFAARYPGKSEVTVFSEQKQEQFDDGMQKFVDEAKRIAKFNSDWGIVHVYNTIRYFNTAYIIMEYLDGETLSSYLDKEKKIPPKKAVEMLTPAINSLKIVHKEGIIHRDIAPDNIFITKDGHIKLIDFGAARYATTTHSRSLTVIIKPGYSPEEQYRSRGDQGAHTDVYSIAATLYKMITGQTPPDALERRAYFENKGKDTLLPLRKYVHDIDENIETAILNAMNIRIEDRTRDMETFLSELTSTEPVKRRVGRIKRIDPLRWPLWAKIALPAVIAGVAVFMVLLSAGLIVKPISSSDTIIPEGQTRVPSVIGHNLSSGEERLKEYSLSMEIGGMEISNVIPENYILTQDVQGGAIVPENTLVKVTVSTSKLQQIVPNVIGMDFETAESKLTELDFTVTKKEDYSDVFAEGCVITQSADPLKEVDDESEITLTVSKGRNPDTNFKEAETKLPDFTGISFDEAVEKAKELNFLIKVTAREYNKDYAIDAIISQNPQAEKNVKNTQTIELVVSLGYDKVTVPSVQYKTEEKAKSQLLGHGLNFNVTYKNDETVAEGLVISQTPKAETKADPESTVELVVSKGAKSFEMPDVVGMQEDKAKETLSGSGLSVTVSYETNDSKPEGEVLKQSVEAGKDVKRGDEIMITVATRSSVITVPNVVGKTRKDAEKAITDKGLKVSVVEVNDDKIEKGKVISQNPSGGSGLKKNDMVVINVSLGKASSSDNSSSKTSSGNNSSKQTTTYINNNDGTNSAAYSGTTASNSASTSSGNAGSNSSRTASSKAASSNSSSEAAVSNNSSRAVEPAGISLNMSSVELYENDTMQLSATVSPSNATDKTVTWSSNNNSVAQVNGSGLVTAVGEGTAAITATASNGISTSCSVTVRAVGREDTALIMSGNCGNSGGNVQYELYESGNLYISGSGAMEDWGNNNRSPWYNNNDIRSVRIESGVTSVGSYAFYQCEGISEVSIANGVYSIGTYAFDGCKGLTEVFIPNSVTSMGNGVFASCTGLTRVTLPETLDSIGTYAFAACENLTDITMPNSVFSIGDSAFVNCVKLSGITIPDGVNSIGNYTFAACKGLTEITIPGSVSSIGEQAFSNCEQLTRINFKGDKPSFNNEAFILVTADVYYPNGNSTWNNIESTWNGGGTMTFHSYTP